MNVWKLFWACRAWLTTRLVYEPVCTHSIAFSVDYLAPFPAPYPVCCRGCYFWRFVLFLAFDDFLSCLLNILVTQVTLMEDVQRKLAEELVQKCPTGVFDIENVGSGTVCFQNGIWLLPDTTFSRDTLTSWIFSGSSCTSGQGLRGFFSGNFN